MKYKILGSVAHNFSRLYEEPMVSVLVFSFDTSVVRGKNLISFCESKGGHQTS